MLGSGGNRVPWADLPPAVHDAVAGLLGSPVVQAVSQPGGFSPGSADRVLLADGRRAFVKTVDPAVNPFSGTMHRREARIARALPAGLPAAAFLGSFDEHGWTGLAFAEVPGRTPHLPWTADDLDAVLAALDRLARAGTPTPVPGLPTAQESLAGELPAEALALVGGDTLAHLDVRADNLLVTGDGAVLVDWPHAGAGAPWLDTLLLLAEVDRFGGHDVDGLLRRLPVTRDVDPVVLTTVLAGFATFFLDRAAQPAPPGLPTLRTFQRVQGEALVRWVGRRRTGP